MIERNLLQEKIIDKMADAFLKALPAGETGIWSSTFARADLRQQWLPLSTRASMRSVWIPYLSRRAKPMPIRSKRMSIDENELCKKILDEMVDAFTEALYGEWFTYHPREISSRRQYCPPARHPVAGQSEAYQRRSEERHRNRAARLVTLAEQCRR
jgi:hypothetical protein